MLKEYDKHDKVIHTLNSTTDTYFDQGSYLSLRRGECMNAAIGAPSLIRPLSNAPFNWPFSLGLPWKHGNKPLHPRMYTRLHNQEAQIRRKVRKISLNRE